MAKEGDKVIVVFTDFDYAYAFEPKCHDNTIEAIIVCFPQDTGDSWTFDSISGRFRVNPNSSVFVGIREIQ